MSVIMEEVFEKESPKQSEVGHAHPFSYESLSAVDWSDYTSIISFNNYKTYVMEAVDANFIRFEKAKPISQKPTLSSTVSKGWKLHISIYDPSNNNTNLLRAWAIVVQTSIEFNIELVKIIRPHLRESMRSGDQLGKEITWYAFKDELDHHHIQDYLTRLTIRFRDEGVIPGQIALHDQYIINGSNYFGYYNDKDNDKSPDPFKDVRVEVHNQPERSEYDLPKRLVMDENSEIPENQEYNQKDSNLANCSKCCRW